MSRAGRLAGELTEGQFQRQIIHLARLCGWRVVHFRPAMTARGVRTPLEGHKGFVDLVLARAGVVWHWELKSNDPRRGPDADQVAWGEQLGETYRLLRPADWDWIEQVLR